MQFTMTRVIRLIDKVNENPRLIGIILLISAIHIPPEEK